MEEVNQRTPEKIVHTGYFYRFVLGALDLCLLNVAFFSLNYWECGTFDLSPIYVKLLFAFYGIWLIVLLATKKFRLRKYQGLGRGMWTLVRSGLYLAYCVSVMVVLMGLYSFSRGQIFGTCLIFVGFECVAFCTLYFLFAKTRADQVRGQPIVVAKRVSRISWVLFVVDFVLVGVSFFIVNYFKRDGLHLLPDYEKLLLIIYGIWFICALGTRKFELINYTNIYHALWPWIKALILMIFSLGLIVFISRLMYFSRTQVFGPMVLLLVFEILFYRLYFVYRGNGKENGDIESALDVKAILKQEELPLVTDLEAIKQSYLAPVRKRLRDRYLKDHPGLYDFISKWVDLDEILRVEMIIRNSSEMLYTDTSGGRHVRLFINLNKLNDVRWINRYFLDVHQLLVNGGYFVGRAHTITTHRDWLFDKYPKQIAACMYAVDFLFNRIFPKLPWVKNVYFSVTKGRNRIISRAELLGRLCFCGFEIVAETEINKRICFVARKVKTPSLDQNPSYGPFVTLNRVSQFGKMIELSKLRTMYPYSEYLQEYIYQKQGTQKDGDKFRNDFRVTEWGKLMRAIWLDELPALYNLIRGDIKLVGVRPISIQKFDVYDTSLQELRIKHKPGLLPPKYADLPETIEDFMQSEEKYLREYEKHPFLTDFRYFFKIVFNIIFKRARSK